MKQALIWLFLFVIIVGNNAGIFAQDVILQQTLTRGQFWFCGIPNGSQEHERGRFDISIYDAYPGGYEQENTITGSDRRIFNVARINGEEVGWQYQPGRTTISGEIYAIEQTTLVKNYNLVDPTQPEEYYYGTFGSAQYDEQQQRHMQYEIEGKVMVWSLPKYDDFVIMKCKLTNTDDVVFEDYYYTRKLSVRGPGNPLSASYDVEYLWEEDVSEELGFIYYDDTSWDPISGEQTTYLYHPGTITGDRGDPGNIKVAGSGDKKLYSPHLYAFSFLKHGLTLNKNGESKVWRTILSRASGAPFEDKYQGDTPMQSWSTMVDVLSREQPQISWREAHENYQTGDRAGSLYERNNLYLYAIGPYDIAPGESIEWIEIWLAGQMDRNITILGDTTATLHFVKDGLENLKVNWIAAKELIDNDFAVVGDIPPPTPAETPRTGNENELIVEAGSVVEDGVDVAGVYLTWKAVHEGYNDPIFGVNDFAGYKIYQSDISFEGPWKLLHTLDMQEINDLSKDGDVTYFHSVIPGVPYRYCVTSFDQDDNESAKTAYNLYPVSAARVATNNLSSVQVVPNPFRQQSGFLDTSEKKRIAFVNIPAKCTIRVYTVALDLVRTLEHDGGGETTWGSITGKDYMLTDFAMNIMPGVYIYHVESHVQGHEGESSVGKLVVIK